MASEPPAEEAKKAEPSKKRSYPNKSAVLHQNTLRHPQWTYFHLSLFTTAAKSPEHDALTARQNLSSALSKMWGLTGWSMIIDILKLEGPELWVRIPRDNAKIFHEAVATWIGDGQMKYVVVGRDDWLVNLCGGDAQDLF